MNVVNFIEAKKAGRGHTRDEITQFIKGVVDGSIPDYQTAAWLMAVCLKGLSLNETIWLTDAYVKSGKILDLSDIKRTCVDKHSTGGVGDKTTLIVTPILAACGLGVAKLSGRGLGLTGGTIDKLESIPGFQVQLTQAQFLAQIDEIGMAIASQTAELAPADGLIYALRDVTGTVASIPLIAASVMSKKIAAGAPIITLDVKFGQGAFMKTLKEAEQLAKICIQIGEGFGRKTKAILSNMDSPLGQAIGNTNEVIEAIETLKGNGSEDLTQLCYLLTTTTLEATGLSKADAKQKVHHAITSGEALSALQQLITKQGGNPECVNNYQLLPQPKSRLLVESPRTGFIASCDALEIAKAAFELGAGREKKTDRIDHGVGVVLLKKLGDSVSQGEPIAELWVGNKNIDKAKLLTQEAFIISDKKPIINFESDHFVFDTTTASKK